MLILRENRRHRYPDFANLENQIHLQSVKCQNILQEYKDFLKSQGLLEEVQKYPKAGSAMYGYVTGSVLSDEECQESKDYDLTEEQLLLIASVKAKFYLDREWLWELPPIPTECSDEYKYDLSEQISTEVKVGTSSEYNGPVNDMVGYNLTCKKVSGYRFRVHNFLSLECETHHKDTYDMPVSDVPYYIPDDNFIDENPDNYNSITPKQEVSDGGTDRGSDNNTSERADDRGGSGDSEEGTTNSSNEQRPSNTTDDTTSNS